MTWLLIAFLLMQAESSQGPGNISIGAMLGLIATWVGFAIGLMNFRRGMRADAERLTETVATRIAKEQIASEVDRHIGKSMGRAEQERVNTKNDERYDALLRRVERLEDIRLSGSQSNCEK